MAAIPAPHADVVHPAQLDPSAADAARLYLDYVTERTHLQSLRQALLATPFAAVIQADVPAGAPPKGRRVKSGGVHKKKTKKPAGRTKKTKGKK